LWPLWEIEVVRQVFQRGLKFFHAVRSGSAYQSFRWLVFHGALLAAAVLFVFLLMTGAAAWYTSRPQFCNSCHIMEPYYKSWQESSHKDVSCIECHFPPGIGGKVRGKVLGLVQLAKYVTKSAGTRPSAEVSDASCLRSGCHETRLLTGRVDFHGVPFDHTPHLQESRRGKQLRCTSCHSQIVQGKHMTVTASTCFLCHFKGQKFNEGLGACTRCHQIPSEEFDLGGGVKFNHDLAYEKGTDCATCHGDVIRGAGDVPRDRCLSCHNREGDLARASDHVFMHAKHVTEHKVDCLQCHTRIEHSLDKEKIVHAAADCQSCHPNHHRVQIEMLRGEGAKTISTYHKGMLAIRVECKTCHQAKEVSATGSVLWKGSSKMCAMCHDEATVKRFEVYHVQLRSSLPELQAALRRAQGGLPADNRAAAVTAEIGALQHDLDFLRAANDIHNMHYAAKLEQALVDRVSALCRELKVEGPKTALPTTPPPEGKPEKVKPERPPAKK
jgi:predicted CXXCH cytochrome family protein